MGGCRVRAPTWPLAKMLKNALKIFYLKAHLQKNFWITTTLQDLCIKTGSKSHLLFWIKPYVIRKKSISTLVYLSKDKFLIKFSIVSFFLILGKGNGVQWSTLNEPISVSDDLTMGTVWIMFLVDILLYSFLIWYIDNVR